MHINFLFRCIISVFLGAAYVLPNFTTSSFRLLMKKTLNINKKRMTYKIFQHNIFRSIQIGCDSLHDHNKIIHGHGHTTIPK